jgi:hypothetical protein
MPKISKIGPKNRLKEGPKYQNMSISKKWLCGTIMT